MAPVQRSLWAYEGTAPRVMVAAPDAAVAAQVAALAQKTYSARAWLKEGRALRAASLDGVVATMVHPPPRPQTGGWFRAKRPGFTGVDWVYRIQHAAAFILAGDDRGLPILRDLANGPMDWTVDAALVALTELARERAELREGVISLLRARLDHAATEGNRLAASLGLLRLPGVPPEHRDAAYRHVAELFAQKQ
jgi:hypothetical protein